MRSRNERLLTLLGAATLAASIVDLFVRLAPAERRAYLYNADLLYLPSLFADIARGGSLADWRFSNAPYLFPDIALFLPLWALAPTIFVAVAFFGLIQLLLLTGGFAWLAGRVGGAGGSPNTAFALVCGAAFCSAVGRAGPAYDLAIASVFHVGLLVVMPFALAAAIDLLAAGPGPRRRGLTVALALLTGLSVASDPLYLFQVALPLVLMCALLAARRIVERRAATLVAGVVGLSAGAGVAAERLSQPYRGQISASVSAEGALAGAAELAAGLPLMLHPWPWLGLALMAFVICGLWVLLRGLAAPAAGGPARAARLLALGTVLGGFAAMLAVALLTGRPTDRYLLNVLYLGPFLGWPLLVPPAAPPALRRAVGGLAAAGGLALLLQTAPSLRDVRALAAYGDYYPPLVACLDDHAARYGLRSGIAQYWQARPIEMLSRRGLEAVTVRADLAPWHWLGSIAWYRRELDFAVVDRSSLGMIFGFTAETLTRRFGPPAATFSCGDSEVYVYNRPGDAMFRDYALRSMLRPLLAEPGQAVTLQGADLPGPMGTAEEIARVAAPGEQGYLVLSDWLELGAGVYTLRATYAADSPAEPGFIELVARANEGEIELTGGLPFPPGRRSATARFVLDAPAQLQIQLYASGQGRVSVEEIQLTRAR